MPQNFYNRDIDRIHNAMNSSISRLGIIQGNLANVNTTGYKEINPDSIMFSQVLSDMFRDESSGAMVKTEQNLDLAIDKTNAFFLVEGPNGPERTRDGRFTLNAEGKMVNTEGKELVILDRTDAAFDMHQSENIEIGRNGEIEVNGRLAGRIAIDYENREPGEQASVLQGRLESSNVDMTKNIMTMIQTKRHIDTLQNMMAMEMITDKSLMESYGRNV